MIEGDEEGILLLGDLDGSLDGLAVVDDCGVVRVDGGETR